MEKNVNIMPNAPKHPFSASVKAGDYIFVSGQGGFESPDTAEPVEGIEAQTRICLDNMRKVLEAAGSSLDDVVKVTVFLSDSSYYEKMNKVYRSYFPKKQPARSTAITGLAIPNMLIEIECIACCP